LLVGSQQIWCSICSSGRRVRIACALVRY